MTEFFSRNIRPVILLLGFVSSLVGTLGSFLFIDSLNDRIKALADRKNGAAQIARLGEVAGDYFIANQQGDLIYALGLQEGSRKDLLALIPPAAHDPVFFGGC